MQKGEESSRDVKPPKFPKTYGALANPTRLHVINKKVVLFLQNTLIATIINVETYI